MVKLLITLSTLLTSISLTTASVAFTAPVASTTVQAGKAFKATWIDSGTAPTLATFGAATINICIGGTSQEIVLASLGTVNVATASQLSVTVPATVGPNGNFYFFRADSTTTDPTSSFGAPYQAFSAKFTLSGSTGVFNATEAAIASGGSSTVSTSSSLHLSPALPPSLDPLHAPHLRFVQL